ncbi:Ig-like and fibronectin type-III domain-containing protein 2, partial [Amphibalanus amphitrite]|uniref:Ig-like and fibronectin type-III domain-containing protein 2 n=1 Tax=Amphibalanus amphitrite TaxID=1232801 RepID=UPI001C92AC79
MAATGGRLLLLAAVAMAAESPLPDLSMSVRKPITVTSGRDALLTCVVNDLGNHTLLWKKVEDHNGEEKTMILTAGAYRVTNDSRVMVLHDIARRKGSDALHGGDVFVLAIQNASVSDTGMYVCEVNSSPVVRSYHQLTVSELGAATSSAIDSRESYDYTSCCQRHNVSDSCIGLCNLYGLHNGNQSEESDCEADFPHIIQCMADGRNHMPCCEEQGVPAMCSGICRGQYVTQRDSIKDHFSCVAFSSIMLNCVARGLDTLPSAPRNIQVSVKSLTELQVTWSRRRTNAPPPDLFTVNVTRLRRFDGNMLGLDVNGTELGVTQAQDTQLYN